MAILKVLVVCVTLLCAGRTTMAVLQGQLPPPTTVVHGDILRITDRTPTVYLVRQIHEDPTRPATVPHYFTDPFPISEPHGTTGWVPVMPPLGHLNAVPRPVQFPQYHPSTVIYPLEKPQNQLREHERRVPPPSIPEPHPQEFVKEMGNPRSVPMNAFAVQETTVLPTEATRTEPVTEPAELVTTTEATTTVESVKQLSSPVYSTNNVSESDFSPFKVTEQSRGDSSLETAANDATATQTVVPTEVRTVATPGGERGRRNYALASGAVAGIVVGAISIVALLTGLATYIVLRRPFVKLLNGNDKSSAENVAYIDDSFRGGYMNTHVELPKESSEEMTSLDNDSFLNSLEAVTIQNYWADSTTTKNTNV